MKRNILLVLLVFFTVGISAQKSVRKSVRKGNSAFEEQRYSAAEADYAKALEENASSKQASFNLANTLYKQQRWDEALKEYEHYLTLENENPQKMGDAWSNVGNTYLKKKANEKAQAQGAMPQQGAAPQQQAQQADNLKASMEAYKNALRLNPTDNETRENLAIVQKMIKDQEGDGGGGDDNQDQDKNEDKKEDKKEDKQQDKDKNQDKKEDKKQDENQMSQENIQQILEAIEQDERETQARVNQAKAEERKRQNERNRRQDKDW